jgi:hypothetical protein
METAIFEALEHIDYEHFGYSSRIVTSPTDYENVYDCKVWNPENPSMFMTFEIMYDTTTGYSGCVIERKKISRGFQSQFMDILIEFLNLVN